MMFKRGFTLIELMIVVAFIGIAAALGIALVMGGSRETSREQAVSGATTWAASMGIENANVTCVDFDTDGDGYVSCNVGYKLPSGEVKIQAIECAGWLSLQQGCRTPKPSMMY